MKSLIFSLFFVLSINSFGQNLIGTEKYLIPNTMDLNQEYLTEIYADTLVFMLYNINNNTPNKGLDISGVKLAWYEFERLMILNDMSSEDFYSFLPYYHDTKDHEYDFNWEGLVNGLKKENQDRFGFVLSKNEWELAIMITKEYVSVWITTQDLNTVRSMQKNFPQLVYKN